MGNNNTVSNFLEPPQSVSSYSSTVGESSEEKKQPSRPPMTAKIEPVIKTGFFGMQNQLLQILCMIVGPFRFSFYMLP
jgi:hypothetical protein